MTFGGDNHGYGNQDKNHAKKKRSKRAAAKASRKKNRGNK